MAVPDDEEWPVAVEHLEIEQKFDVAEMSLSSYVKSMDAGSRGWRRSASPWSTPWRPRTTTPWTCGWPGRG